MTSKKLMIFDDGLGQWGPLTDLRSIGELRTGAITSLERIERYAGLKASALLVGLAHEPLLKEQFASVAINTPPTKGHAWLIVNARCVDPIVLAAVAKLPVGHAIVDSDQILVAAYVSEISDELSWQLPTYLKMTTYQSRALISRPWHVLENLPQVLADDLSQVGLPCVQVTQQPIHVFGEHPLQVDPSAQLMPGSIYNTQKGPIVIERDVVIHPTAVIEGPCFIGRKSQVYPNSYIRNQSVVGPVCKVAGEVSHSIFQSHSNKAHQGYLGHGLIGKWVNLGAQTNVSNMKNTYGEISVQLEEDQPRQPTGQIFCGPVIGDYVRTAIGSRLLTGSVIGTACMLSLSGFAPLFAARFGFYTDAGMQPAKIEKVIETAKRMMARRDCELTSAQIIQLKNLANPSACHLELQAGIARTFNCFKMAI